MPRNSFENNDVMSLITRRPVIHIVRYKGYKSHIDAVSCITPELGDNLMRDV